jgi:L-aspartate oxidase
MQLKTDFLIVGSGIAGLSYALKVATHGTVLMLTKANKDESNTKYAQGGIAAVTTSTDSFEKHVQDTLIAGDFICDRETVEIVVREAPERIQELIDWGTEFDKTQSGAYDLAKEGGHSDHRILHHKDNTGFEIERALLTAVNSHPNIEVRDHYFALELITQHHLGVTVNSKTPGIECYGIYALNSKTNQVETLLAKSILMATGGCGHIYETTTNPVIATGDGVAMVYRAKGKIENMEFIQFHPTSLYNPGHHPSFLISEAVRGFGAILKTKGGVEFMEHYDARKSLAPRDIVARAIDSEMKIHGDEFVYLDCTHLNPKNLVEHFPMIHNHCLKIGFDMRKDLLPVLPAAHYQCGGIKVDKVGKSSIRNLYAVGECASTGLHGANRLASNSLLEAVVFSHRAALDAIQLVQSNVIFNGVPDWNAEGTADAEELVLITQSTKEVQAIMSNYVGIVRSNLRLKRALDRLLILHNETENLYQRTTVSIQLCELRNMIKVGYIILKSASQRKESIGLHFNSDYPKREIKS